MNTPKYIKSLVIPNGNKPRGRKVWSIDLETVWLPFFMATNIMGDTAIPNDALGAPLRLSYNQDGTAKFNKSGRPTIKVVKELADSIRTVRENFTAQLTGYAGQVIQDKPEQYKQLAKASYQAGQAIIAKDKQVISEAIQRQVEAMTEPAEEPQPQKEPAREPELVTA